MDNRPGNTSLKKTHYPSLPQQPSTANNFSVRGGVPRPLLSHAGTFTALILHRCRAGGHSCWELMSHGQKVLVRSSPPGLWLLPSSYSFSRMSPDLHSVRGCGRNDLCVAEHSVETYVLHLDRLWISALTITYWTRFFVGVQDLHWSVSIWRHIQKAVWHNVQLVKS